MAMRKYLLLLCIICSTQATEVTDTSVIRGVLNGIPNPCLTIPCLPGMVWGVKMNSINYVLSKNGHWDWMSQPYFGWDTIMVYEGDSIVVSGKISIKYDSFNVMYREIEITSLEKISPNSKLRWTVNNRIKDNTAMLIRNAVFVDLLGKSHDNLFKNENNNKCPNIYYAKNRRVIIFKLH